MAAKRMYFTIGMQMKLLIAETLLALSLFSASFTAMPQQKTYAMLCLGDSYTIGESVAETERFPNQTVKLLEEKGIAVGKPVIIAKTGWTTDELADAIKHWDKENGATFSSEPDVIVTLLIGVNNEYRGRDENEYRTQFAALLSKALKYAHGNRNHVFVISIPDWGATPFAANDPRGRSPQQIGAAIDRFNAINKEESLAAKVHYVDITPISRKAVTHPELVANDGLHPSGKMYAEWSALLAGSIEITVTKDQ
jgi:lysophospholipase L1-like esterase